MPKCFVSYLDTQAFVMPSKLKPKVLYEAAALAVKAFKEHELEPGGMANLEVEIRKTITHTLTVKRASRMVEWRL